MKNIRIITCVLVGLLLVSSCKKKKESEPTPEPVINCDIPLESSSTDGKLTYEYDGEDRLVKQFKNGVLMFSVAYQNNGKTVVETHPDAIITYTLNNAGLPEKKVESTNSGNLYTTYYLYDINGLPLEFRRETLYAGDTSVNRDTSFFQCTLANGNMIKMIVTSSGGTNNTLNMMHDLTKLNNLPNPTPYRPIELLKPYKNKNLMTNLSVSGTSNLVATFDHDFDSKGRVSKQHIDAVQGSVHTVDSVSYIYRCD